jgi:4-amino-4-deoxy-L-arabinose transferase-like glycosyltransferase
VDAVEFGTLPARVRDVATSRLVIVFVVAGLSLGLGLGQARFWEPDEPRFAEATRQMFERADFLTPYLNGVPRFEKPILFYWLQAPAYAVFGATEFAARLPSALAGLGSVLLLYGIGRRMATARAAFVAALVLATMFRFVTYGRQGLTDVPVLFFIVAAVYGFVRATQPVGSSTAAFAGWASIGLGVLTKGPIGLVPLVIWGSYAAVRRDRTLVTRVNPIAGAMMAAAIALPWYIAMIVVHGRGFLDFALGHEVVARALSEAAFAPPRGFFYYFKVWPGDAAPWSLLFIAAVGWAIARWRHFDRETRQALVFSFTWFLSVFLLFSMAQSKVPHYVLPAYPAAALVIGVFVDRLATTAHAATWWRVPYTAIAIVTLVAAAATALFLDALLPGAGIGVRWLAPAVLCIGGGLIAYAVWNAALLRATYALTATLAATFALLAVVIVPSVDEAFKPMPRLARDAQRLAVPGARIGLLGRYGASSLIFYSGHNIRWLDDDDAVVSFLASEPGAVCVMPLTDFTRLEPRLKAGVRRVATAEEFNVRLERVVERRPNGGRVWVLITAGAVPSRAGQ